MAVNDPVADLLTRIRNAIKAQHRYVDISWSKIKQNIGEILKKEGLIESYLVKHESKQRGTMRIFLKYKEGRKPAILGLKRISKPGLRKYVGFEDIPLFFGGMGLSILSTSQGIMGGTEAKQKKIGGELLCQVW